MKAKRFEYLFEQLRAQAKAKYGNLSTDELDFKLCKIVSSYSLSQKEMYKAIKLILSGANVNAQDDKSGHNILHLAAKYGNADIVQLLIDFGANINDKDKYGYTAFLYAVDKGRINIVKLLIKHKADVNVKEFDP